MAKPRGLGRGLDALLAGDDTSATPSPESVANLPLSALQPGRYQPRTRMDEQAIAELAESIRAQGIIQPILVRPVAPDRYEIIAGERRWRAAQMAGLATVPVLVRDIPDQQALAAALIENIQREDLNPLEEATGIERLVREFSLTHQAVADAVGKSRTAVTNLLRLLELPGAVRDLVSEGALQMGHARALLPLPPDRQLALAREAAAGRWSVREVEKRASAALEATPAPRPPRRRSRDVVRLEEELSDALGTPVRIESSGRGQRGRLVIAWDSLDQLDVLLARLRPPEHGALGAD